MTKLEANWRELCPELIRLEKSLEPSKLIEKTAKCLDASAAMLNRWGHPEAHTLQWMEDQAIARIRIDEELARIPTEDSSRTDSTALPVQKQANDDDFVLDQGFSTGCTDRKLREQDQGLIAKAHDEVNVDLRSEYIRRDSLDDVDGPLDMGCFTESSLGGGDT